MRKHLIDRLTATAGFRFVHVIAALFIFPVLGLGVLLTPMFLFMSDRSQGLPPEDVGMAVLSMGGALGMVGWLRAILASRAPERHNITATLVCLALGAVTALAVCGYIASVTVEMLSASGPSTGLALWVLAFAAANVVWIFVGIGWIQRLTWLYAARTGKTFDGLPAVLLFMAVSLAIAATLVAATL